MSMSVNGSEVIDKQQHIATSIKFYNLIVEFYDCANSTKQKRRLSVVEIFNLITKCCQVG